MGPKTVANDLDNARIKFQNVFVPRGGMLSRLALTVTLISMTPTLT